MKQLFSAIGVSAIVGFGIVSPVCAADIMAAPHSQTITGDVQKIDGEYYVVKEPTGKEVRLHVDKTSQLEGSFKPGDKVVAQASDKGHAISMKHGNDQQKSSE